MGEPWPLATHEAGHAGVLIAAGVGWHAPENCWAFPEQDGAGNVVNILRRWRKGKGPGSNDKRVMQGGGRGLFIPDGWRDGDCPVFLPEGASNTLALAAMSLPAVGRPNNTGGVDHLAALLGDLPAGRRIIVVGDTDPKEDGRWPGKEGAVKVAGELEMKLGRPVLWALPPAGSKDVRQWLNDQRPDLTCADVLSDLGERLAADLVERAKEAKAKAGPAQTRAAEIETFTAADLMGMDLPPPRWVVDGVIPEGLSVLAGKPKLGKSWFLLHVALAVASGGVALGKIRVQRKEVLYISLEDTKRRLQSRIRRLLGPDEPFPEALHLCHACPRQDRGGIDWLDGWLEQHPAAGLVIIDTWGRWRPFRPGQGSNYDQDYADGAALKELADRRGVPTWASAHCRKMPAADPLEEVCGSVGLTGACDGVLVMRRERGQHDATLMVTGRDVEETELALAFDPQTCLWQQAGDVAESRLSKERRALLDLFRPGQELALKQVVALAGKSYAGVRQMLSRMARDGQLEATEKGEYRRPAHKQSPELPSHQEAPR